MFAVAFDLVVRDVLTHRPAQNASQAYGDIKRVLLEHGFEWRQGSVYTLDEEDMSRLFGASTALKAVEWFPPCVRDIRAFRVEQWSDFTSFVKA